MKEYIKEHLTEWLIRFGTRDDVTWREVQQAGLNGKIDFGYMARKGYLVGIHGTNPAYTTDVNGAWRYHLTANGLEYLK